MISYYYIILETGRFMYRGWKGKTIFSTKKIYLNGDRTILNLKKGKDDIDIVNDPML
jgi:hypothetical protein